MKTPLLVATILLVCGPVGFATEGNPGSKVAPDYEHVGRIPLLGSLDGWRRIDDDSLIIWATPFRPYLVELSRKSRDMKFAETLAVTSSTGQVAEKFDSVIVDGIRYPIRAIYKLDRQSAKKLTRKS